MATTSFNKKAEPVKTAEIVKVAEPVKTVSTPAGFEGEFSAKDVTIPTLMLMQKQSKGFDKMPGALGSFVYDNEIILGQELDCMFFAVRKFYVEDLPYGSKETPRTATTMEQAMSEGWPGTVDAADLDLMLGIKPEVCGTNLGWYTDKAGVQWVPARYQVRKNNYRAVVGIILKDLRRLGGDLRGQVYTLHSSKMENNMGTWYAVQLRCKEKTDAKLLEFHDSNFGGLTE